MSQFEVRGEWLRTSQAPLSPRHEANVVWSGSEVVVFGGDTSICPPLASCLPPSDPPFADGAAYDPLSDTWRSIADAPMGLPPSRAIAAGTDIYVLTHSVNSSLDSRLLRYRPTTNSWTEIDLPEKHILYGLSVFENQLIYFLSSDEYGQANDWLLDSASGQWQIIPDDPLGPGFGRQFVEFEEDLYLFDHALLPSPGGASGPSYLRAARYRNQQWRILPSADSIGYAPPLEAHSRLILPQLGCADGGQTNGYGRCIPYGAVFNSRTDTWSPLPDAPGRGSKYIDSSGGIGPGDAVLYEPGQLALDATSNEWFIVPALESDHRVLRRYHSAGPYGFVHGGVSFTTNGELLGDTWIWHPDY